MANEKHLAWLKEGVEAWNRNRERATMSPDLSRADFSHQNLTRIKLGNCILNHSDFSFSDLSYSDISLSSCKFANFAEADLWGSQLANTDFRCANLKGASLKWASCPKMDVRSIIMEDGSKEITDLSEIKDLTQGQIDLMIGDQDTKIPSDLTRPGNWLDDGFNDESEGRQGAAVAEPAEPRLGIVAAKMRATTAPFEVRWAEDGTLELDWLIAVPPEPQRALPATDESAQIAQLSAVGQFAGQIKTSIRANSSPNIEPIVGDLGAIFEAIETEVGKPEGQVLIVVIRANVHTLERLAGHAEALTTVDKALFHSFLAEARRLFRLYPILNEIEDPHHAELVPEDCLPQALAATERFIGVMTSDEVVKGLGPSVPTVTRDMALYPWRNDREKVAAFAAIAVRIKDALENPPQWIQGLNQYSGALAPIVPLIIAAAVALLSAL